MCDTEVLAEEGLVEERSLHITEEMRKVLNVWENEREEHPRRCHNITSQISSNTRL